MVNLNSFLKNKIYFVVLLLYALISYVMVYLPVSLDIFKMYLGGGEVVMWSNYFWWFDYAVTSLHINPLYNSYLYYPMGMDMIEGGLLSMFLFIPITHVIGSTASYNIYVLLTFILSGFGIFLLADYLINDKKIAFISGLIFSFCPFHFAACLGHLHTFSYFLLPFFALYVHKMFDSSSKINVIICSIFFACNALTSWTVGIMALLFLGMYLIINVNILKKRDNQLNLLSFTFLSSIFISPGLYYIVKNIVSNKFLDFPIDNFIEYSADLLGFVVPSPFHPLLGSFSIPIYNNFTGNFSENVVFIGYLVLLFALVGFIFCRRNKEILPYIVTFVVAFLFSLGPILHINGSKVTNLFFPGILPFFIPGLDMIRVPARYDILIMFCLSIIAVYGIKFLFQRYQLKNHHQVFFCILIICMILFEFIVVIPTQNVVSSPLFYHKISTEVEDYTIMDIPAQGSSFEQSINGLSLIYYDEYQKTHRKKVIGGYQTKFYPLYIEKIVKKDPILSYLFFFDKSDLDMEINPLNYLNDKYGIRYIVIHPRFIDNGDLNKLLSYLGNDFYYDNSIKQDPLIVYQFQNSKKNFTNLGVNEKIDIIKGTQINTRYLSENMSLFLYREEDVPVSMLSLKAMSNQHQRTLSIIQDGVIQKELLIAPGLFAIINIPLKLRKGLNIIDLQISQDYNKPSNTSGRKEDNSWIIAIQPELPEIICPYFFNTSINFNNISHYSKDGYYLAEDGFRWTKGTLSSIEFGLTSVPANVYLNIEAAGFTAPGLNNQTVLLSINEKNLSQKYFFESEFKNISISIPQGYLKNGLNTITFYLPNATSPKKLEISDDGRILGLSVRSLSLTTFPKGGTK